MLISILKFLILCYDRLYESHKVFVSFYELWGIMKQKEYYTAGELARLFNIPKQTMLYYDKTGVLQPEFIAENGYRYYATPQYLTLEIILFLRKMDISVPDIRNFLQHKSREEILKSHRQKRERVQAADTGGRDAHAFSWQLSGGPGEEPVSPAEPGPAGKLQ